MLTFDECFEIAMPYLLIPEEYWENNEAYFFDDYRGQWEDDFGIVVFKEDGKTISLHDYFNHTNMHGIMKNFWLYGHPHDRFLPEGWGDEA